jgi:hypothetical protein
MEDYTYFLNSIKNGNIGGNKDKFSKMRPYKRDYKDYKDYDNPKQATTNTCNARKLISYDDL